MSLGGVVVLLLMAPGMVFLVAVVVAYLIHGRQDALAAEPGR